MFIKIDQTKSDSVSVAGAMKISTGNGHSDVYILKSPNHRDRNEYIAEDASIEYLTNTYPNDSFIIVNRISKVISIVRDWPGNVPVFYNYDKNEQRLLVTDNISSLSQKMNNVTVSKKGISLFLNSRKHYHTHTIYENIEILHPGFHIDMSIDNAFFSIHNWYKPYKKITIEDYQIASQQYLEALDNVLVKLIDREKPIALMFSGGSDSVLLLDRIIKLGYNNICLFTICFCDYDIVINYAKDKAKYYNLEVNPICVSQEDVWSSWTKLFEHCYHYLSDLRIDGMFSPSINVFNHLSTFFGSKPSTIVWGSQYALISPMMNTGGIIKFYFLYMLKKLKFLIPLSNRIIEKYVISHALRKAAMLNKYNLSEEIYTAYKKLYLDCFNNLKSPEQLLDLYLSTNYNSCKHWWMDWRGKIQNIYYPSAINVYPFHDRSFQEMSMPISLKTRVGGLRNLFRMPNEYKNFFYSLLPKDIPISSVKKGNYKALPEFHSLFKNKNFYNNLIKYFKDPENKKLIQLIKKDTELTIPESYDSFLELDYLEVERLSGVMYLIIRFKTDDIPI